MAGRPVYFIPRYDKFDDTRRDDASVGGRRSANISGFYFNRRPDNFRTGDFAAPAEILYSVQEARVNHLIDPKSGVPRWCPGTRRRLDAGRY